MRVASRADARSGSWKGARLYYPAVPYRHSEVQYSHALVSPSLGAAECPRVHSSVQSSIRFSYFFLVVVFTIGFSIVSQLCFGVLVL
ncbi:unnamed protein product [Acanthoscelides obtectus]|uniref:Uncharacterized protein n=1 Tax=Acanthoscelides obtectus TaxID=200917 RepID=A0A9P0P2B0_ACAOB|nr:unnamed protein product [Acanthoscelides obtectus]CAK1654144.1 hypothetical protein AOBTE_LOCUS18462 [Acanthoscelides obtectus]